MRFKLDENLPLQLQRRLTESVDMWPRLRAAWDPPASARPTPASLPATPHPPSSAHPPPRRHRAESSPASPGHPVWTLSKRSGRSRPRHSVWAPPRTQPPHTTPASRHRNCEIAALSPSPLRKRVGACPGLDPGVRVAPEATAGFAKSAGNPSPRRHLFSLSPRVRVRACPGPRSGGEGLPAVTTRSQHRAGSPSQPRPPLFTLSWGRGRIGRLRPNSVRGLPRTQSRPQHHARARVNLLV